MNLLLFDAYCDVLDFFSPPHNSGNCVGSKPVRMWFLQSCSESLLAEAPHMKVIFFSFGRDLSL